MKATLNGGRRYTPIDLAKSQQYGYAVRDDAKAFTEQYKDYFRADFRIGIKRNGKHTTQELAFDGQNIFNTKNQFIEGFNKKTGATYFTNQLGFVPIILYRLEF